MAANLFEYYQSQNKPLPSLQERGQIYQSAGLGSASTYSGTAQQNTSLLGYLQKPTSYTTNSPASTAQYSQFLAPPSTYKPPAVMTSSAPTAINQGISYLSNVTNLPQSNPSTGMVSQPATGATGTAPKPPTGTSAPTGQTPPQGNPLAITSPDQTLQNIVSQTNELLKNYSSMGGTFTPEIQKQISSINGLDATTQALTVQAQTALQNNQFESFIDFLNQRKESQKMRDAEIQKFTNSLQPFRDQYLKYQLPSQGEQDLQMQLADLQKQQADFEVTQSNFETSLGRGLEAEQGIGRAMSLTTGRQAALERQAQFGRQDLRNEAQSLRNQENLLLNRLGIAQGNRELQAKIAEKGLAFAMEDRKFAQEVFDKQEDRDNQTIDLFMKYNTLQRQEAADILSSLSGQNPENFSPDTIAALSQISAQRGIDVRDILGGLQTQYDKEILDQVLTKAQITKTLKPDTSATININRPLTLAEQQAYGLPAGSTLQDAIGMQPLSPTTRQGLNAIQGAIPLIDTLETMVSGLNLSDSISGSVINGAKLQGMSLLPATKAGQYAAQVNAFVSLITRALGEKGTLATFDVERIKAALPGFYDTKESADSKLNTLRTIMNEVYNKNVSGYYENPQLQDSGFSDFSGSLNQSFGNMTSTNPFEGL